MTSLPFLADRASIADASRLLADHGAAATLMAADAAARSRAVGNHLHFCRWRQIERLIPLLATEEAIGTVH